MATLDSAHLLSDGELTIEGRLLSASNATFVGTLTGGEVSLGCVYKPVRGERPLWDFPDGTLANRERAAYLVSEAAEWGLVPPTVLRAGPFGPGMVQQWIDQPDVDAADGAVAELVDVVPLGAVPPGWLRVLDAENQHREPVSLVHAKHPSLRRMAVLDAVINNADRKGGHVLVDGSGRVYGCDHGVCFHEDAKLRTVLWGWAGEPLGDDALASLSRLLDRLDHRMSDGLAGELARLLSAVEVRAFRRRVERLLSTERFPRPSHHWPSIPWPAF
jgi:uncharacterized repeat protein (TIGR03843 family)